MLTKQLALWGNIFGTIAGLITVFTSLYMLQRVLSSSSHFMSVYILNFVLIVLISVVVVTVIVIHILTWIAYAKLGTPTEKGWRIFLFVIGIIWTSFSLIGLFFSLVSESFWLSFLCNLLSLTQSVFFILTFALKDQNSRNSQSSLRNDKINL